MMDMSMSLRQEQRPEPRRKLEAVIAAEGIKFPEQASVDRFVFKDYGNHIAVHALFTPKRTSNKEIFTIFKMELLGDALRNHYHDRRGALGEGSILAVVYDERLQHYRTYEVTIRVCSP